jgi:hypothetical protein
LRAGCERDGGSECGDDGREAHCGLYFDAFLRH